MKKYTLLVGCVSMLNLLSGQTKPTEKPIFDYTDSLTKVLAREDAWGDTIYLGKSKSGTHKIYAYYYNRRGTDKAMVMAGVHGSEFYGVDVVDSLKARLDAMNGSSFKWKIILLPKLFPENVDSSRNYGMGEKYLNFQRCTKQVWKKDGNKYKWECVGVDPNRQMPKDSELYEKGGKTAVGGEIELENQYLLQLVQAYNPSRIASVHCKNEFLKEQIGIYADPKTDKEKIALGFSAEAVLALKMAFVVKENGGRILGNFIDDTLKKPFAQYYNAVYPQDPKAVLRDTFQERNSSNPEYAGKVSFGTWASSRIYENGVLKKDAATTITIELPQSYSFSKPENKKYSINTNTSAYVKSLIEVFLLNQ